MSWRPGPACRSRSTWSSQTVGDLSNDIASVEAKLTDTTSALGVYERSRAQLDDELGKLTEVGRASRRCST